MLGVPLCKVSAPSHLRHVSLLSLSIYLSYYIVSPPGHPCVIILNRDMAQKKLKVDLELLLNSTTTDGNTSREDPAASFWPLDLGEQIWDTGGAWAGEGVLWVFPSFYLSRFCRCCPCSWLAEILPSAWWRQEVGRAGSMEIVHSTPGWHTPLPAPLQTVHLDLKATKPTGAQFLSNFTLSLIYSFEENERALHSAFCSSAMSNVAHLRWKCLSVK